MPANEFFKTLKLSIDLQSEDSIAKLKKQYEKVAEDGEQSIQAKGLLKIAGVKALTSALNSFIDSFSEIVNDAMERMNSMLSYSQMTSGAVRDLKLGYGFSSSEAYGYQTALDVMGFSDMEDLMWANEQQLSQFREAFDKYSSEYTKLYDEGYFDKMQEYQVEMKEFRLDLEHEIIEFFMNNKDTIMTFMDVMMNAAEITVAALGWLVDFFGEDERTSEQRSRETDSILNSYVSSSKSTNVNIANTFNNVSQSDTTWLANAGQMTYNQTIEALK